MLGHEEDDEVPGTQPIMSGLLHGVVAYVEVRSGHDNRSRGVKAQLRNLGAKVEDSLTNKVTHVVFNEGLPSTYKKAKKLKCHLVSVLWIGACKEQLTKVSEAGYPPIGQQIYENPHSLKNFKKLKSMQPDFDDDADDLKIKQLRQRIQRRRAKAMSVPKSSANKHELPKSKGTDKQSAGGKRDEKGTKGTNQVLKPTVFNKMTPGVINKVVTFAGMETSTKDNGDTLTRNGETLCERSSSQESSAVGGVMCEELKEAGPSRKKSRSIKPLDNTPITQAEFIEGLNNIMLSLSEENDSMASNVTPSRKRADPPPIPKQTRKTLAIKKPMPIRRSPRNVTSSVDSFVSPSIPPRKRPKLVEGIEKINKKSLVSKSPAPHNTSASATLMRKKYLPPPSSPDSDLVLLSQQPGDMPSLEELAKARKGSIDVGGQLITLSQIIRVYNNVEQGPTNSPTHSCGSSSSSLLHQEGSTGDRPYNGKTALEGTLLNVHDDIACGVEEERCYESRCSSEAGSAVSSSSTSTKVLINGNPPENTSPLYQYKRDPSPIFVTKKSKFRKILKRQPGSLNTPLSSATCTHEKIAIAHPDSTASTSRKDHGGHSSNPNKLSRNPIDFINKCLLPRFSSGDKTPSSIQKGNVLVEETPDIESVATYEADPLIIPSTPAEKNPQNINLEGVLSTTQSSTDSVVSWVKRSCKVPLFSSQSNTPGTLPRSEQQVPSTSTFSTNAQILKPCKEIKSENLQKKSTKERVTRKTRATKVKVVVTVVEDNGASGLMENSKPINSILNLSPVLVKGVEGGCYSSGYETSNSAAVVSIDQASKPASSPLTSDTDHSTKQQKITNLLSPAIGPAKKISEIYENDELLASPVIDSCDSLHERIGRKRNKSVPESSGNKQKVNHSVPQCSSEKRAVRIRITASKTSSAVVSSDLSSNSIRCSERKSSEEAKKRMKISLTPTYNSNALAFKVIVCSFLTPIEQNGIEAAVQTLKGWKLEERVTAHTTHVISSGPKRTMNVLKGMVRGLWLLDQKWVLDSSKAGTWLEEEKYELVKFSPAVRLYRVRRHTMGKKYKHMLFARVGPIYVSPKAVGPPVKDIHELLELCGADLKTSPEEAKLIIGRVPGHRVNIKQVHPRWVLDCITKNKILPVNNSEFQI